VVTTDKLRSYGAAFAEIGITARHEQGCGKNNRAEVSHQPVRRRERKMQRFKSPGSAQRFVRARRHLQHVQRPAPPDLPPHASDVPCGGHGAVACGDGAAA
jgi:transposase-like protein